MKMKIGIVGGALQGMEAVLLAKKAGYESLVIDRKSTAPAASLADHLVLCDVVNDTETAKRIFSDCDAVIPACEELDALHILCKEVPAVDMPLLFDMHAYEISCSKERSTGSWGGRRAFAETMAGMRIPDHCQAVMPER